MYYFDFANGGTNGDHEWRISDSNAKVIAGQPNAVPSGSTPVGPVTLTATGATTSSPGFTGTADAILIGGNLATTGNFNTSNQQRYVRATGYNMGQQAIPPGSSAPVVQLHIVHGESWEGTPGTQAGYVAGTALPTVTTPCPTAVPAGQQSTSFCPSSSVQAIGTPTANALFATNTASTRSITLAGGWTGTALPAGATVTSLTARVAHRESTTATGNAAIALTLSAGAGCSATVPTNLSNSTLRTDPVVLPACFGTDLSALSISYNASYTCSTNCPSVTAPKSSVLDGIDLTVNYTTAPPPTSQFGVVQALVRNAADNATLCTVNLAPTANGSIADATLPLPAGCLSQDALNNGTFSLRYVVNHAACSSACQNVTSQLDGMELQVSYSQPGRPAWDPNDPNANPTVPGACRHDGDPFWTDGVQFVFGGDSRVNLQSGQVELCDQPSTDHQEIVLYGVKGSAPATQAGWHATTATPSTAATTPCPTSGARKLVAPVLRSTRTHSRSTRTRRRLVSPGPLPPRRRRCRRSPWPAGGPAPRCRRVRRSPA